MTSLWSHGGVGEVAELQGLLLCGLRVDVLGSPFKASAVSLSCSLLQKEEAQRREAQDVRNQTAPHGIGGIEQASQRPEPGVCVSRKRLQVEASAVKQVTSLCSWDSPSAGQREALPEHARPLRLGEAPPGRGLTSCSPPPRTFCPLFLCIHPGPVSGRSGARARKREGRCSAHTVRPAGGLGYCPRDAWESGVPHPPRHH